MRSLSNFLQRTAPWRAAKSRVKGRYSDSDTDQPEDTFQRKRSIGYVDPTCLPAFAPADIAQRATRAAQDCWDIEDRDVIYLAATGSEFYNWRSILQAFDLTVWAGANGNLLPEDASPPLVLMSAAGWRAHREADSFDRLAHNNAGATACVMTGFVQMPVQSAAQPLPVYQDARSILQAAGIGFFSVDGFTHA